jgi:hypothetical protein
MRSVEALPLVEAHQEIRLGDLTDSTNVIEVQMRDDRFPHVAGGIAHRFQLPAERVFGADVEPEEAPEDEPRQATGKIGRVSHDSAVLSRIEEDQSVCMLDDAHDDGQRQPPS